MKTPTRPPCSRAADPSSLRPGSLRIVRARSRRLRTGRQPWWLLPTAPGLTAGPRSRPPPNLVARLSGGDYQPDGTAEVTAQITKLLCSNPPSSCSAAASEAHRWPNFKTDRASARRWAIAHQLAPNTRYKAIPTPVKRWQASDYGGHWQYHTTPHACLRGCSDKQVLLEILDDATRLNTGTAGKRKTLNRSYEAQYETNSLRLVDWGGSLRGSMPAARKTAVSAERWNVTFAAALDGRYPGSAEAFGKVPGRSGCSTTGPPRWSPGLRTACVFLTRKPKPVGYHAGRFRALSTKARH